MDLRLFTALVYSLFAASLMAGPIPTRTVDTILPKTAPSARKTEKTPVKEGGAKEVKTPPKTEKSVQPEKAIEKVPENYRISANDLLEISVYRESDLDTKARVNEDGTITFPLLGNLKIGGLSVTDATRLLTQKLGEDYLVNPQVTVNVIEFSKRQFTVLGSVRQPGVYSLPNNRTIDLLQAIASAGGFSRAADVRHVTVQRRINGKDVSHKVNAEEMQGGSVAPFEIQAGDTITVAESLF